MILGFNDAQYYFLNNKYSCSLFILNRRFGNAEAAYQAHKTKEPQIQNIFTTIDAVNAQSLGRRVNTYEGWDNDKIGVMLLVVFEKFRQNPELLEKLLATGDQKLVSISVSHEKFWGTYDGEGENILGKILMYIRQYFCIHQASQRQHIYTAWEDVRNELELLKIPIREYGKFFRSSDLDYYKNIFTDFNERMSKLNTDIENYLNFFIVDNETLTEATKHYTN